MKKIKNKLSAKKIRCLEKPFNCMLPQGHSGLHVEAVPINWDAIYHFKK